MEIIKINQNSRRRQSGCGSAFVAKATSAKKAASATKIKMQNDKSKFKNELK